MFLRYGLVTLALLLCTVSTAALATDYPPTLEPKGDGEHVILPVESNNKALIFSNVHNYGSVEVFVQVFDNFNGDASKYHWVYTVTNNSFDPNPPVSNGFSGFELALVQFVPDIGDLAAPNANWVFNCCSGQPVEWDIPNTGGPGLAPGVTGVFSFTTAPRAVTISDGWFHTWETDIQTNIVNYPPGEGPESPDFQTIDPPDTELCCYFDASGAPACDAVLIGECEALSGNVIFDCAECEASIGVEGSSWGSVKGRFDG